MMSSVTFVLLSLALLVAGVRAESAAVFGRPIETPDVIARANYLFGESPSHFDVAAIHLTGASAESTASKRKSEASEIDCNNDLLSMEMKLLCHYYSQY